MPDTTAASLTCSKCFQVRASKSTRLPNGWKRKAESVFCDKCWRADYILRAITIPIASPAPLSWDDFNDAMAKMWALTTQASNWIVTELYARDVRRTNEPKMPAMTPVYLYPELRQRFPDLPPRTVSALEHAGQRKYRATRYDVIWTCRASLPTFRYPVPFPIPAQGISISAYEQNVRITLRIGELAVDLRLKAGPQFHRQRRSLEAITAGIATLGEVSIYKSGAETLVKIAAWLPRPPASRHAMNGVLRVRTAADRLLIAANDKDDTLWNYNADHLARWIGKHRSNLQRWSEDFKYEQRPVPSFAARRAAAAKKFNDRMTSACHEIAAQLAAYARRHRFAQVLYDDTERGFVPSFPYHRLSQFMQIKLDEMGIGFAHASAEAQSDIVEALAPTKG